MGAVRLHIDDLREEEPMPEVKGYLAEEMIQDVIAELIIGIRRDPIYGATVLLGFGGVQAELLDDTQTLVLPISRNDIAGALSKLKLSPLLQGYRGSVHADIDAVIETVLNLQELMHHSSDIDEIEINPLLVLSNGAVAADALIRKGTK